MLDSLRISTVATSVALLVGVPLAASTSQHAAVAPAPLAAAVRHASRQGGRGQITLYPLTLGDPVPTGIAAGADGNMWFADFGNNEVGRITMQGTITEFPDGLNGPNGVTAGPDGAIWVTETTAGRIGRVALDGHIKSYGHEFERFPQAITNGPDGALWFTEFGRVNRITTDGTVTRKRLAGRFTEFGGITTGPDGALWFTQEVDNSKSSKPGRYIVRMTTDGSVMRFHVGYNPQAIAAGPDGAMWFTEATLENGEIGRLSPSGTHQRFKLPGQSFASAIAAGPDGALWFTASGGGGGFIGRITTSGHITKYPITGSAPEPQGIAAGPDGAMWFTCVLPYAIGRITTT